MYLEVFLAALAAFMMGFGWYTALFGKAWQRLTGLTDEEANSGMAVAHGGAFLMMMFIAFGINFVVGLHPVEEQTFIHGGFHGLLIGLLYCVPALSIHYLYQRKPLQLWLIDASYVLIFCGLMGGVLAALKLG